MIPKWTGEEKVEYGQHTGEKWKDLHRNTLEWYRDNLVGNGPLKVCAKAELKRRDEEGEF